MNQDKITRWNNDERPSFALIVGCVVFILISALAVAFTITTAVQSHQDAVYIMAPIVLGIELGFLVIFIVAARVLFYDWRWPKGSHMIVTIRDLDTGNELRLEQYPAWMFARGQWDCDCSRGAMLRGDWNAEHEKACEGHSRFLVVSAFNHRFKNDRAALFYLNRKYPRPLLTKHISECA